MFYFLASFFKDYPGFHENYARLFEYVTFRAAGAFFTALVITIFLGPSMVRWLKKFNTAAGARYVGEHFNAKMNDEQKNRTPSMGGILIIGAILLSTLLWANMTNPLMWAFVGVMFCLSVLGFFDDYAKIVDRKIRAEEKAAEARGEVVVKRKGSGITSKQKLLCQILIALGAVTFLWVMPQSGQWIHELMVPFVKDPIAWVVPSIDSMVHADYLGILSRGVLTAIIAYALSSITIIGASNAVNLTDGKDGLATGCLIICMTTYMIFSYISGHKVFAEYLLVPFIPSASEVVVFCAAMIGACAGFLWWNCFPASMFMGDTGSLALGGSLGLIAVLVRQELVLIVVGGVFVMEAGSVIIQVASCKLRQGKRVFLCTPIHHHFEHENFKPLKWTETQIVTRFWLLGFFFALLGLVTLKLR